MLLASSSGLRETSGCLSPCLADNYSAFTTARNSFAWRLTGGRTKAGLRWTFPGPGKLTDNALIESFNGSLRHECLNTTWFVSLADVRKLEAGLKLFPPAFGAGQHRASSVCAAVCNYLNPSVFLA